jgi:hypothetical protein
LSWSPVAGAEKYCIFRLDDIKGGWAYYYSETSPYTDTNISNGHSYGLINGHTYTYTVLAVFPGREPVPGFGFAEKLFNDYFKATPQAEEKNLPVENVSSPGLNIPVENSPEKIAPEPVLNIPRKVNKIQQETPVPETDFTKYGTNLQMAIKALHEGDPAESYRLAMLYFESCTTAEEFAAFTKWQFEYTDKVNSLSGK